MPIHGAWAEFVCLPASELVPVPPGLDAAEAVSVVLNYVAAYQMIHRSARVAPGQRALIHGASGGVGTALHLWRSGSALRPGGRVVGYGLSTSLRGEGLPSTRPGRRQRFRGTARFAGYVDVTGRPASASTS